MNRLPSTESLPDAFLDLMDTEGESESDLQSHEVDLRLLDFEDNNKQNEAAGSAHNLSQQKESETLLPEGFVKMNTNDNGCCSDEDIIEFLKDGTEEAEESSAKGGVHPLLFPDVIRDIMNHLPAKDVEICRLVCRSWNNEACKVLKTKRVIAFMDADAVRVYNTAMRNTTYFPHAQFEFCIQDFTGLVDEDLREFWNIFGLHIKSLELRQTHLFWRDFYEVVEQKLPNLEKLTLRHLPRHVLRGRNVPAEQHRIPSVKELRLASLPTSDFGQSGSNERLTTLLKALPNLEVIEFLPIKQAAVQTKVSNVVVDILRKPEILLPHLRRVNLNLELNTEGMEALTVKQFPLQRLQITLSDGIKATSLKDLLMSLRPTLTELKIGFPDTFSNYQTFLGLNDSMKPEECVQILTNLKALIMTNFKGSINFVHKLLGLKDLRFTTSDLAKSIPFGFKRKCYSFRQTEDHNLQSLQITSSTSLAETLTLDGISRCFPYLSCLRLHAVDDDGLGVIYRNLPFLSEVELVDANCTDQGLTGIPLEICNDMVETCTFIVVQADRYRRDLFIGSLQFLRKFSITASKISDAAIALGLVDCKNLRELKIGSPLITDTGVIFITDKFCRQLDLLDVSNCSEITEQSKFYAGEKISGKLVVAESQEGQPTGKQITKPVELTESDRAIVKTKRSSMPLATNAYSKFLKPDVDFFEEHTDEEARDRGVGMFLAAPFPDNGNRQRIIRIREALRRNAEFMRTLQRLGIVQFRRLYRRELQEGFFRGRLLEGNLERLRRRELAIRHLEFEDVDEMLHQEFPFNGQEVPGVGVANVDIDVVVVEDEEEPEQHQVEQQQQQIQQQQPGAMNLDEDDGGPQGDEALPNRLPDFHIAEIFRLGLRLDDVEYWLRNRNLFERDEQGNNNANPGGARGWDIGLNLNLAEEEANGGAAANPIGEDEDIDLAAIRRAVMHAFGDEFEDAEPPFVALPRIN
ncbi:hypothetical protein Ocin01_09788 [Orchesella cincta]|uniref:F-box domain-containing protein n=1 Tax=Orchesella cincta TaxID=48709 RepID=A0A1D2MUW6_ORCCI|nr:hypothetical protein Ocin01_09788 [Orchesella cincta]